MQGGIFIYKSLPRWRGERDNKLAKWKQKRGRIARKISRLILFKLRFRYIYRFEKLN